MNRTSSGRGVHLPKRDRWDAQPTPASKGTVRSLGHTSFPSSEGRRPQPDFFYFSPGILVSALVESAFRKEQPRLIWDQGAESSRAAADEKCEARPWSEHERVFRRIAG